MGKWAGRWTDRLVSVIIIIIITTTTTTMTTTATGTATTTTIIVIAISKSASAALVPHDCQPVRRYRLSVLPCRLSKEIT